MSSTSFVEERRSLAVGVLGAGRLGCALAAALAAGGYGSLRVASRRAERARALAAATGATAVEPAELAERCTLVFLAVPEGEIAGVAAALPWRAGEVVAHCSGALGLEALEAAVARSAEPGCLHPLQTFPAGLRPEPAVEAFRGIVCGVEGAGRAGRLLEAVAEDLGARSVRLEGVDRALYHAAAALVSNDVVALTAAAGRAWTLAGLPAETGRAALAPLLLAAAQHVQRLPLERALTGPVARGDVATVERHLRALEAAPELHALYRQLAAELLRLDLGHARAVTAALRRALAGEAGAGRG